MPWEHLGSVDKINNVLSGRGWSAAKRSRFHDWLTDNYPDKDRMERSALFEAANKFEREDSDSWKDSKRY
jgi:hypothetical protein